MRDLGSHAVNWVVEFSEGVPLVGRPGEQANIRDEHVDDKNAVWEQVFAHARKETLKFDSGMQVNQRISRDEDQCESLGKPKIAHVGLRERDRYACRCRFALTLSKHRGRKIDADYVIPGLCQRNENAPGSTGNFKNRTTESLRRVQVKGDVSIAFAVDQVIAEAVIVERTESAERGM